MIRLSLFFVRDSLVRCAEAAAAHVLRADRPHLAVAGLYCAGEGRRSGSRRAEFAAGKSRGAHVSKSGS